jgi:hypothetical protein
MSPARAGRARRASAPSAHSVGIVSQVENARNDAMTDPKLKNLSGAKLQQRYVKRGLPPLLATAAQQLHDFGYVTAETQAALERSGVTLPQAWRQTGAQAIHRAALGRCGSRTRRHVRPVAATAGVSVPRRGRARRRRRRPRTRATTTGRPARRTSRARPGPVSRRRSGPALRASRSACSNKPLGVQVNRQTRAARGGSAGSRITRRSRASRSRRQLHAG